MHKKRNIILIALLFVAVLSACIIISIKESSVLVGNQSSAVSSLVSKSSSSAVLSSANITASTSLASSVNNTDVEKSLNNFKQGNSNYQFFDFALSTCDFSDNMIEAAVSFYSDKKSPQPNVQIMTKYGVANINLLGSLSNNTDSFVFAENGKITITGPNDLKVAIQNIKTKEIYDCYLNYKCSNQGRTSSWNLGAEKRGEQD